MHIYTASSITINIFNKRLYSTGKINSILSFNNSLYFSLRLDEFYISPNYPIFPELDVTIGLAFNCAKSSVVDEDKIGVVSACNLIDAFDFWNVFE